MGPEFAARFKALGPKEKMMVMRGGLYGLLRDHRKSYGTLVPATEPGEKIKTSDRSMTTAWPFIPEGMAPAYGSIGHESNGFRPRPRYNQAYGWKNRTDYDAKADMERFNAENPDADVASVLALREQAQKAWNEKIFVPAKKFGARHGIVPEVSESTYDLLNADLSDLVRETATDPRSVVLRIDEDTPTELIGTSRKKKAQRKLESKIRAIQAGRNATVRSKVKKDRHQRKYGGEGNRRMLIISDKSIATFPHEAQHFKEVAYPGGAQRQNRGHEFRANRAVRRWARAHRDQLQPGEYEKFLDMAQDSDNSYLRAEGRKGNLKGAVAEWQKYQGD